MLLCCQVGAAYKDWHPVDKALFTTSIALDVVDVLQLKSIIHCQDTIPSCPYYEGNFVFGKRPEIEEVVFVKLLGNYIIYKLADKNPQYRTRGLIGVNAIRTSVVLSNKSIGVTVSYNF